MNKKYLIYISVTISLLIQSHIYALAGLSEISTQHSYNNYAKILWEHPSDYCSAGDDKYCFSLVRYKRGMFKLYNVELEEINVPDDHKSPYIIGRQSDNTWIIYNFEKDDFIIKNIDFNTALASWKDQGFEEPQFANAKNLNEYFRETITSLLNNIIFVLMFTWFIWLPFIIFLILVLFLLFYFKKSKEWKLGN